MVVVFILIHAEFGLNDHRQDTPHFKRIKDPNFVSDNKSKTQNKAAQQRRIKIIFGQISTPGFLPPFNSDNKMNIILFQKSSLESA